MAKATKAKKVNEYRSLDDQGLVNQIGDEASRLKKMKFGHAVNPIENPLAIRDLRRNIARLKTEQRKRALGF